MDDCNFYGLLYSIGNYKILNIKGARMSFNDEIDRAIDSFKKLYNVKPKYLILSFIGRGLLEQHFGGISREKLPLRVYKGLQIIITKRRDIIFDLF